ncbi:MULTISPECIES: DMT family transporter [unclassified Moorena]|uniref:DMT family transporter n=1 Tax=unclassified Moorena TaxID=2683338 RepID=UPI0013C787CD|nr:MULTISPECIES: DMT family transporter [unclassified Moorena]NEO23682.1 DMT family transporter [Moorena sp. SIO4A5]NEQ61969.1 DMT family transporter [Moorena sp. SIO4A1]
MNAQGKLSKIQYLSSFPIDSFAALIGSIICLSFSPIFIRLSELEMGPNATAFNRFWIAAVAFGLLNNLLNVGHQKQETEPELNKNNLGSEKRLLIADGLLLAMALIAWTWSLTQTSVANSSIMHNMAPIFTILGGWLAFGQLFDRRFIVGMFVAIAGVTLLEVNDLLSLSIGQQLLGDLAALLSAVFFGVHPLIAEQLRTKFNSVTIMTWSSTTSFLLLFPVAAITEEQLFPSSVTGWFSVIALAFVGQMLGVGLWTYCLKKLSSGFASLVGLIVPVLSSLEGWTIFSEPLSFLTLVSFVVILVGMYLAISSRSAIKSPLESTNS